MQVQRGIIHFRPCWNLLECDRLWVLPENGRCTKTRATFQSSRFSRVRFWAVITLKTLQWEATKVGHKTQA